MIPFSSIGAPFWDDAPLFIVGGGTSIEGFDLDRIRHLGLTLGVNKSAFVFDTDALFSLDQHFTREHRDDIQAFADKGREVILAMPVNEDGHQPIEGACYIHRRRDDGLSYDNTGIYGVNSGYSAISVGYLKRATKMYLLGFDMQYGKNGKTHCHGGYPWHNPRTHKFMDKWAGNFNKIAEQLQEAGVVVVNCVGEPMSKIPVFTKRPLDRLC